MFLFQIKDTLSIVNYRCNLWRLGVIKKTNSDGTMVPSGEIMKKISSIFLVFIFMVFLASGVQAAESVVQLAVPGCFS
jgi:hypothetical protein